MAKKRNRYIDCGSYYKIELYHPFTYDLDDYALISKDDITVARQVFWRKTENGYARGRNPITGKEVFLHKHITKTTQEIVIDHKNRNKLDCRRENLRVANKQVNSLNRDAPRNSTTKCKGVSYDKRRDKYRAYGKLDGKQIWLGYFPTIDEAQNARENFDAAHIIPICEKCKEVS